MADRVFISIIVPVYKVEKYIHSCVQSILNQSYQNFELLLVDDGSPDGCPEICDRYMEQYSKVRALHKTNGGLSDARNYGTARARGSHVTYIDSDDYVSPDYLEELVKLREKYSADLCVGGIQTFFEGEKPERFTGKIRELNLTGTQALERMLYQHDLDTSACAMLLPIETARQYPFPVGKYHEDEYTTYQYYGSVSKVAVTTKPIYFYLQRRNSIMHTFGQASLDELDAADNLVNVCKERWPQFVHAAKAKKFSDYCQVLLSTDHIESNYPEIYRRIADYLSSERIRILCDPKARIKNRAAALIMLFGVNNLLYFKGIRRIQS